MVVDPEKTEEHLRSDLFAALTELTFAPTHERAAIVERLSTLCEKLKELVTGRSGLTDRTF
jgi:hypothetical protein